MNTLDMIYQDKNNLGHNTLFSQNCFMSRLFSLCPRLFGLFRVVHAKHLGSQEP